MYLINNLLICLAVWLSVCLSVCLSVHLPVCMSVYIYIPMCMYIYIYVCLCLSSFFSSLFVPFLIFLYVYILYYIRLFMSNYYLTIYRCMSLSIDLPTYLPTYLSIYLSIYMAIDPSISPDLCNKYPNIHDGWTSSRSFHTHKKGNTSFLWPFPSKGAPKRPHRGSLGFGTDCAPSLCSDKETSKACENREIEGFPPQIIPCPAMGKIYCTK